MECLGEIFGAASPKDVESIGEDQDLKSTQRPQRQGGFWPAMCVSGLARSSPQGESPGCPALLPT